MAQISLKNYLAKLESLLDEAAADEVIQHSRHLLKYFPKNAAVFRSLGLGLLLNGRWQEAESALRRVLTALPDDYRAHLGLSEVYTTLGRGDQAIWHLERAFEQNPNSRELIDGLRGLYRRFRQTERTKIQLTTGAIARQYRRSGMPQQAIALLRSALERAPERLDLSLLLADTLWETGAHVEAAEMAVDILKHLPDCIIANQIMTRLWLEARRPSDAVRYLSRIEAVDPILAYEIVQGPVPENAFMVDEIDYQRAAQTELVARRPDWLQTIGVSAPSESAAADAEDDQPAWLREALSKLPDSPPRKPDSPPPAADDDDWMASVRAPSLTGQLDLPPEFSSAARDVSTGELKALFEGDEAQELPASWELSAPARADDDQEQPTFDDFTFDFSTTEAEFEPASPSAVRDSRPAWLMDDSDEANEPNLGALGSEAAVHDDIPDWMRDALSTAEADDFESMDWLKDELFDSKTDAEAKSEQSQVDSFDWLTAADDAASSALGDSGEDRSGADEGEVGFDWLDEPRAGAPEAAPAEWLTAPPDVQPENDLSAAPLFYSESQNGEWKMTDNPQPADQNEDSLDWLSNTDDDFGANSAFDMPELDSLAPSGDDLPDWMSQMDEEASAEENLPLNPADIPDWLLESGDSQSAEPVSAVEGEKTEEEEEMSWLSELAPAAEAAEEDLSWLSDVNSQSKPSDPYQPVSASEPDDEFSWLSEKEPEPADADQTPEWLAALEEANEQGLAETKLSYQFDQFGFQKQPEPEAESAAETPDWLAELEPDAAEAQAEPEVEPAAEMPDWLAELEPDAAEAQAEPEVEPAAEMPDWLAELEPDAAEAQAEPEVEPAAEMPDWLAELEPDAAEAQAEPEVEPAAEMPDWLAELEPDAAEAQAEPEVEPAAETPDWLAELEPDAAEARAEPVTGELDWLAGLHSESETDAAEATAAVGSAESAFGWYEKTQSEAEPAADKTPEWEWLKLLSEDSADEGVEMPLTEVEPDRQESSVIAESAGASADVFEFEDEIAAPAPAENAPDWLNAMVPD
jgi:tetratricopeptide (TPR) repeat protein